MAALDRSKLLVDPLGFPDFAPHATEDHHGDLVPLDMAAFVAVEIVYRPVHALSLDTDELGARSTEQALTSD